MDLVVPVIASCEQREGQRAALGSRRPRRTGRERKDRPTSASWVSGAWGRALRVAGALIPLPERAPARLVGVPAPGTGARLRRASPRAGSATFAGWNAACARVRADSEPPPPARGFPASRRLLAGRALRGASPPRTCWHSAALGSTEAAGPSRELAPKAGLAGTSKGARGHCGQRWIWGRSLWCLSPWRPLVVPLDQGTWEWKGNASSARGP